LYSFFTTNDAALLYLGLSGVVIGVGYLLMRKPKSANGKVKKA